MTSPSRFQSLVRTARQHLPRLLRYAAVSMTSTVLSLTILTVLVATGTMGATSANVVASLAGVIPSFELNRRWVWRSSGRPTARQVLPFLTLTIIGLLLSSATVACTGLLANSLGLSNGARSVLAAGSNVAAFGALWLVQYRICDALLFSRTAAAAEALAVAQTPVPVSSSMSR